MQNKNFSKDGTEFTEVSQAVRKGESHLTSKSCEEISWNHSTSTPHRSETKGIAEGAVRRIKERLQWAWMKNGVLLLCSLQKKSDGSTPNERRFAEPFEGPVLPFAAVVEYFAISEKTSQGSTNLVSKSGQEHSSDMCWLRVESGRYSGCRHLGKLDARNPRSKAQRKGNNVQLR